MNQHFSEIGKNLAKAVTKTSWSFLHYMKNKISNSIVLADTDPEKVSCVVLSLDYKKSDGPDEIPIKVKKLLNGLISPILSNIINQCFQTEISPDVIKLAKVIPLHKSGDKTNPSNYRLIFYFVCDIKNC